MVVFADKSKEMELIKIWQQSFGDSVDYIRMFLVWNAARTMIIVYEIDGKAISVAYLLPVTYKGQGQTDSSCWYLYAAATLPEFRGCGYFGEIMRFIQKNIPEPVILVPGEKSLIDFYEKQGLHIWLEENTLEIAYDAEKMSADYLLKGACVKDIDVTEYLAERNHALTECGYMKWDEHFIRYIFHENMICGGKQKQIAVEGRKYIATYRIEDQNLKVLELLPQTCLEECVQLLFQETGCKKAQVCLRPTVMATDKLKISANKGYFNLTMG